MGNHEYYKVKGLSNKSMKELWKDMKTIAQSIPNLHLLNRSSVLIENICIVGCTLWSRTTVKIPPFIVRVHGMTTRFYNKLHTEDIKYIEKMVRYARKRNMKLLVVTHHAPTYSLIKNKKAKDKYKSLYASNLDYLLDSNRIHTWVCGHIHTNFDIITKNGTRLVGNQRGKSRDRITDFLKDKVISI